MNGKLILRTCGKRFHIGPSISGYLKEFSSCQKHIHRVPQCGQVIRLQIFWLSIESWKNSVRSSVGMS